ncbi:uncharacterized protein TNCV_2052841 [Trichonephila clavipes]|nr:uncharacterized protein TNCV_2052841 [Trichonephila clavipes]
MALYRSPLTVTLWPSSFLKKYGPMIPPAHKAHETVSFSGCNGVSTYTCGLASLQMRQFCLLTFQECDEEDLEAWMTCDAEDCEFQLLNDDEIVTSVQEESDPVDDETDEYEGNNNNESSKGPSNADAFSALESAMEWYEQESECCPTQVLLLKRIRDLAAKKNPKVYNVTAKMLGFIYCMDRIRFSVIRTILFPNVSGPNWFG